MHSWATTMDKSKWNLLFFPPHLFSFQLYQFSNTDCSRAAEIQTVTTLERKHKPGEEEEAAATLS